MTNPSVLSNEPVTVESLLKLAHTIDQFEQYARPHASQMTRLAESLALRIGISGTDLNSLKIAALMHDIGEMIMDSPALRKGGQIEFKHRIELWRHPIIGEQQLAKRELPRQAQLLVRWHHEKWNGSGYPDMLSKETIPIGARILRLVDTYDALTANRPYRDAYSFQQAQNIIEKSAGIEFDPYLVKVFLEMLAEMFVPELPKLDQPFLRETTPLQENIPSSPTQNYTPDNTSDVEVTERPLESSDNSDTGKPTTVLATPITEPLEDMPNISSSLDASLPSPEEEIINVAQEEFSDSSEDVIDSKPEATTQSLFAPSSNLTRDLLATSYLSEPPLVEPSESASTDENNLPTNGEENHLDKSQENAENKPE